MNRKLFSIGLLCLIAVFMIANYALAQNTRPIVRLIYFLPKDRAPQPDIDVEMETLIKDVQQFFANEMERHGYGRKTFRIETDATGKVVVHHVKGQSNSEYYEHDTFSKVHKEIHEQLNLSKDINLIVVDSGFLINGAAGVATIGDGTAGLAIINGIRGLKGKTYLTSHELRHAFGLGHDLSIDPRGFTPWISKCTAQFLDVHRHFNPSGQSRNFKPKVKMLPPILASPPNSIRLRFEITDAQEIHQAQLYEQHNGRIACKRFYGSPTSPVEFVIRVDTRSTSVALNMIDVHGNISWTQNFPIDVPALLPPAKAVFIPDANLAAALQREIGSITTHAMLNLYDFGVFTGTTNLTGLEHAHNLKRLYIGVSDIDGKIVNSNAVSDFSPLMELPRLIYLSVDSNSISDVAPLVGMTQLTNLLLPNNSISDVAPLASMTQLRALLLSNNSISDAAPLASMTQLQRLVLSNNSISDVAPLANLTQLIYLALDRNPISDVAPLASMTEMELLRLERNPLSYAAINTHIPTLQANGVQVIFDNITHPALLKISGDTQEGTPGTVLAAPFIVEAMDAKGKPMRGMSVIFAVTAGGGQLSTTKATTDATGKAQTLLTLGGVPGKHTVTATATAITKSVVTFTAIAIGKPARSAEDVNGDGVVNIQDLVLVSSHLGQTGQNEVDVNGDGVVNIQDLVLVAAAFGEGAASPSLHALKILEGITVAELQRLLIEARQMSLTDPVYLRGIAVLEALLLALTPKETALLPNYPNPFNPETWIPYQLAEPAEVTLRIHAVDGTLVRTLSLGHKGVGMYQSRSRAAYWDGRNRLGEPVASGAYFYTLIADDFTATRKMLIRK